MKTRFARRAAASAALASLLAACGGGGTEDLAADTTIQSTAPTSEQRARALAAGPALAVAPTTLTGNVTCENLVIGALRLDSVYVPPNAACRLDGTQLIGNITVAPGATLDAAAVVMNGSVQAEQAAHVALGAGSAIGGSVQVKQGGTAQIRDIRITGDLQIDAMLGAVLASGNRVGGGLQAVGNLGGLSVLNNTVVGNLLCKENLPAPVASGNQAALIEGQCVPPAGSGGGGSGGGTGGGTTVPAGPLTGNVTCNGLSIGAVALDTITVPANAVCELAGTRLIGSILIGQGATLRASNVRVAGSLQADGAAQTVLGGVSSIGGSVQLKQGGSASITGAAITGDLQIDAMRGPVTASSNAIGGSLQAMSNRGGLSITANRMAGNLQCKDNLPAPTGSGNVAAAKQDQCRRL